MAKLMLVEDDNNLREIYEARLQAEGYTIVSAKDGEEALVVAKAEKPELIISDVMMPKISGFEMLDILRNTDQLKDVKIIMLTALGQSDDQERADHLGADRYLVKSQVTLEDIVKATHELLGDESAPAAPTPAADKPATDVASPAPAADKPAETPAAAPAAPEPATPPVVPEPKEPAEPVAAPAAPAPPASSPADDKPADTPATDTPADNPPAADSIDKTAVQSTVQEEAAVENKIEDFVSGATQDATPPVAEPTPAAATDDSTTDTAKPADDTVQPEPTTAEPAAGTKPHADNAADDKLVSDAADALVASTKDPSEATTEPEPTVEPAAEAEAPTTAPEIKVEPTAPALEDEPKKDTGSVPIANKKVIAPLNTNPKKDIDELLAIEEAKEAKTTAIPVIATDDDGVQEPTAPASPVITPATGSVTTPTVQPTDTAAPKPGASVDPSSISL